MLLDIQLAGPVAAAAQNAQAAVKGNTLVWAKLVDQGGDFLVNLAEAAVILAITFWVAGWTKRLTRDVLGRMPNHQRPDPTLQIFAGAMVHNVVVVLGMIAVLQQLGVKTTSIIAALGAASLAIGLALQGALSNVAAGVTIMIFRPYRVGDLIDTSGRTGTVVSTDLFVTELSTVDQLKVVIPNGKIFGDVIVNHSFHRLRRADAIIHLPLVVDVDAWMERLMKAMKADTRILTQPAPIIEVTGIAEAFVEIAIRPWVARDDYRAVKADVLLWGHMLNADLKAVLPPPGPSAVPVQSGSDKAAKEHADRHLHLNLGRHGKPAH